MMKSPARIGIVLSRFNEEITEGLLRGSLAALRTSDVEMEKVEVVKVPGAFEIPLAAKRLAETGRVDGIICLGAVIRGETAHFDYLASTVSHGISQVMLETGMPMTFGVLTTDTVEQAMARSGKDEANKGWEAARSLLEFIRVLHPLKAG